MKNTVVAISAVAHCVLPVLLLVWTGLGRHRSRAQFVGVAALTAAYVLSIGLAGAAWPWFGLWWRWVWYASYPAACAVWLVRRWRAAPGWPERRFVPIAGLVFTGLTALLLLSAVPEALSARSYEGKPLELQPPLSGGRIVVGNGGGNELTNPHAVVSAQRYALDILGLQGMTRAEGSYPDELTAYAIWGRSVIAPCAGSVVAMENGLPDVAPGVPSAKEAEVAGNHVILRCGVHDVVLAHLQRGSVAVEVGAEVDVGARLGLVGNSGNTSEPHLHIHAVSAGAAEREQWMWKGTGVPLTFGGRFLVRGDTAAW
jgi:hypothetical protein